MGGRYEFNCPRCGTGATVNVTTREFMLARGCVACKTAVRTEAFSPIGSIG